MNILTIRNKVLKSTSLSGTSYIEIKNTLNDMLKKTSDQNVKEKIQLYFLLLRVLAIYSGPKETGMISITLEKFVHYLHTTESMLEKEITDAKNVTDKYTKTFALFGSYVTAQNIFTTLRNQMRTDDTMSIKNTAEMYYGRYENKIEQFKMQHSDIKFLSLFSGVMSLMQGGGQKFALVLAIIIVGANILGVLIPLLLEMAPDIGNTSIYIIVGAVILVAIGILYRLITRE